MPLSAIFQLYREAGENHRPCHDGQATGKLLSLAAASRVHLFL